MIRGSKTAAACAVLALAATQAGAVTITFDDLAEGALLANQYAAQGVTFSANAFTGDDWATNTGMHVTATDIGVFGTPSLVSGMVLHAYDADWLAEDGDPSFRISFSGAVSAVGLDFASVSTPSASAIYAYDGATLLGTVTATTTGQVHLAYSAAHITSVVVTPGYFLDWVAVDNLSFTPVPVPEASTWGMMALGLGLLAWRRRRA